ncbi:MAG: ChrR family anti-sigma-E factor [Myxococcota bacterium]
MRHPDDALLMAYAAGSLSEAVSLLVATHVSMCPRCRRVLARLDEIGGALLASAQPPSPDDDIGLDAMLARLDEPIPPTSNPEPAALPEAFADLNLPEPLRSYVARAGVSDWTAVLPGVVRKITLPIVWEGAPVRLTRVRGGFTVPMHTHEGTEFNLVLAGGFHDRGEAYQPGDVAENHEDVTHVLHIDPGEDCVILAVNEAPLVPVGALAQIASLITGGF